MQPTDNYLNQINETLTKGQSGIIVLPANPSIDALAAATSLYLGLTKIGKNVSVACATIPATDLVGTDKIQNTFVTKGDNLVISFPYVDGSIDKVDYNIEGEKFNLIVTPRSGQPKLDPSKVQYAYVGGKIDFIIAIDTPNLNSLGEIYTENQNEFQGKTIINIDRHLINNMFGTVNMVVKTSSSTSELVLKVLQSMQIEIDKDIATNLYTGLTTATNYFTSYSVNADTFEAAAELLKNGAVKKPPMKPNMQQTQQQSQSQPQATPFMQKKPFIKASPAPTPAPAPIKPQQNEQETSPIQQQNDQQNQPQTANENNNSQPSTPQDWLKPKIFRGGGLL